MNYIERKAQILDILQEYNGVCNIDILCKKLYASRSTIRRDLIALSEEGIINKYHGGISLVASSASENSITLRRMENKEKKSIIAKISKSYLHDNMVLFLDSSSTVSYISSVLRNFKNITVITNGINVASHLNTAPSIKCYLCPGVLKHKSLSIVGEYSANFLSNFRAEIAFLSCKAINSNGIFEGDDAQALSKRNMIKNADKIILMCDNTKEFTTGYFKLDDFSNIDIIISNSSFSPELTEIIKKAGCQIVTPNI